MRPQSGLYLSSGGALHKDVVIGQPLIKPRVGDAAAGEALEVDGREDSTRLPPPRGTLHNYDVDDVKVIIQLGKVPRPVGLDPHRVVLYLLQVVPRGDDLHEG